MDNPQVMDYIREKTKESKTNFYYSFLFLPKEKRQAIFTVYSFCRETDDIVDSAQNEIEARTRLDAWRTELQACYDHRPTHPITMALLEIINRFHLPAEYFYDLIDGVEMDLTKTIYQTYEELEKYCYHVASVVGLICIEIFGYRYQKAKEYAVQLGKALQLTNILRDVGEDARKGRIYLPQEDLLRFQYREEDVFHQIYSPAFVNLMRFEAERARSFFHAAAQSYDRRDHSLLFPAEIMKKIYFRLLNRIEALDYNVYRHRIRIPNYQKLLLALTTWLESRWRGVRTCAATRS